MVTPATREAGRPIGPAEPRAEGGGRGPGRPAFLTSHPGFLIPTLSARRSLGSVERKRIPEGKGGGRVAGGAAGRRGRRGCSRAAYLGAGAAAAAWRAARGVAGSRAHATARTQSPLAAPSSLARASGGGDSGKGKEGAEGALRATRELGGDPASGAAPGGSSPLLAAGVIEREGFAGGLERLDARCGGWPGLGGRARDSRVGRDTGGSLPFRPVVARCTVKVLTAVAPAVNSSAGGPSC